MSWSDSQLPQGSGIGSSLAWAWNTFRANPAVFVVTALVVAGIQFGQQIAVQPMNDALIACLQVQTVGQQNACESGVTNAAFSSAIGFIFFLALTVLATIWSIRAALMAYAGRPLTIPDAFSMHNAAAFAVAVLSVLVVGITGFALCIIPGILALFLLQFAPFFALDTGAGPVDALRASAQLVRRAPALCLALLAFNVSMFILGGLFLGIPTLLTLPLAALTTAHVYRRLSAPLTY